MAFISSSTGRPVRAVLFDTFGTVVDWRTGVSDGVTSFAQQVGLPDLERQAEAFTDSWRAKYEPSMDPIRKGTREFTLLSQLHLENLRTTLQEFGIEPQALGLDLADLNRVWERLPSWPDSVTGIEALRRDFLVGPLSNANTALLARMAKFAHLPWDIIIGSDVTRHFKPQPSAYTQAAEVLEIDPGELMLAAAHNLDLEAARNAGLATAFVLRGQEFGPNQDQDLGAERDWDVTAASITELASLMCGRTP